MELPGGDVAGPVIQLSVVEQDLNPYFLDCREQALNSCVTVTPLWGPCSDPSCLLDSVTVGGLTPVRGQQGRQEPSKFLENQIWPDQAL